VNCRRIEGGLHALEGIDADVRLRFIDEHLRLGARRARIWAWTWAGIYSSLTLGEVILGVTEKDPESAKDDYLGAAASFVGLAVLVVLPLDVMRDQRWLERRLKHAPPNTDRCALLADAERLLIRDAASEEFGTGPLVHVGNFLFNIGVSLFQGLYFGHWGQAAITGLVGIAVGEIQAFTQPTDVVRALARYRQADLGHAPAKLPPAWLVVPEASRDHIGLRFALTF
jgi:hypothetical protein